MNLWGAWNPCTLDVYATATSGVGVTREGRRSEHFDYLWRLPDSGTRNSALEDASARSRQVFLPLIAMLLSRSLNAHVGVFPGGGVTTRRQNQGTVVFA
ncbi:hypothetical protein [Phenylobacterium sp.]|uniref:hypothetical protein n=1 Tax=Phenylobacterium sp. TaxID=1871053 RepID=UPI002F42534D